MGKQKHKHTEVEDSVLIAGTVSEPSSVLDSWLRDREDNSLYNTTINPWLRGMQMDPPVMKMVELHPYSIRIGRETTLKMLTACSEHPQHLSPFLSVGCALAFPYAVSNGHVTHFYISPGGDLRQGVQPLAKALRWLNSDIWMNHVSWNSGRGQLNGVLWLARSKSHNYLWSQGCQSHQSSLHRG